MKSSQSGTPKAHRHEGRPPHHLEGSQRQTLPMETTRRIGDAIEKRHKKQGPPEVEDGHFQRPHFGDDVAEKVNLLVIRL